MNTIERETVKAGLWKLGQGIGEAQCAWARPSLPRILDSSIGHSCRAVERAAPASASSVVELSTDIDDAIGFEPECVWPVIAMLWDLHGYKGVYDMGVVGVWMSGIEQVLYVCGIAGIREVGSAQE